jgi:hypothetical protein
LHAAQSS